jgi:hypothetical protein
MLLLSVEFLVHERCSYEELLLPGCILNTPQHAFDLNMHGPKKNQKLAPELDIMSESSKL